MANFALKDDIQDGRDWFLVSWMIVVHMLAFVALFHFTPSAFFVFFILYFLTGCVGITFGFHRLLTHRSFKAHTFLERFAATCGTLALQGSPIEWVAHHRMHHAKSDLQGDPHNASNGFWFSHIGWLFWIDSSVDDRDKLIKFARDITSDKYLTWLSRPWNMIAIQAVLGISLWSLGGISWVLWGIFFRLAIVYHVTWLVNSAAHKWGYKNYRTDGLATNNWYVGLLAFGEGWHNNHHAEPSAVHVQHRWFEFDLTWQLIRFFWFFGLIHDVKLPQSIRSSSADRYVQDRS